MPFLPRPLIGYFGCRILLPAAASLGVLLIFGCGDDSSVGRLFAVRGRVTFDDDPLTAKTTVILFQPDGSGGHAGRFEPVGTVDRQGNYTLFTDGEPGAPPGRYRVIVTATELSQDGAQRLQNGRPVPSSLLPAKYGQAATTDLLIEVVENPAPGGYDLKLIE